MLAGRSMLRVVIESTSIRSYGYSKEMRLLQIEFLDGKVYDYFDVPEEVYFEFVGSLSKGQFLNSKILGIYRYAKSDE